jgi:glycosyltransferase involved in cell wall biosynthesis
VVIAEALFWLAVGGVVYAYLGYPAVLFAVGLVARREAMPKSDGLPTVTMIIPVHNEQGRIASKLVNTAALDYPRDRLQVLFVSDGSTDGTVEMIASRKPNWMDLIELPVRGGKASALNAGLARATNEILVFSDASIALQPEALRQIVRSFANPHIGCVSGEDRIADSGGEAWYGRYELLLRRLESRVHSIVGASGSFYAQRRAICTPFAEGMAPDFLSVLRTVEQGYRAVSDPQALGVMTSVKDARLEFDRKVRTLIRGMTALFAYGRLLDPVRYGWFAFALWSHKIGRWTVPLFLIVALLSPLALLASPAYVAFFVVQLAFYGAALMALTGIRGVQHSLPGRIALYFSTVNAAILAAWFRYARGVRQELWTPSHR